MPQGATLENTRPLFWMHGTETEAQPTAIFIEGEPDGATLRAALAKNYPGTDKPLEICRYGRGVWSKLAGNGKYIPKVNGLIISFH